MRKVLLFFCLFFALGFTNKVMGQTWIISDLTGACGSSNVTATLSGNTLTISGTNCMADFYDSDQFTPPYRPPWYNQRLSINTVIIGAGVKNIGDGAFDGCTNLSFIEIPNSVNRIGITSFMNCTSLQNITLHDCITTVEGGAFYGCNSLTVDIIKRDVLNIMYNSNYVHGNEYPFNGISKLRVMPFRINDYSSNGYIKEILYEETLSIPTYEQQSISGTYNFSFACISPSVCATVYKVYLTEGVIYTFSTNFMVNGYVWLYSNQGTLLANNSQFTGEINNYQSIFTGDAYLFIGMNTGMGCFPLSLTYKGYLSTPTGVSATPSGNSISISWNSVSGATHYTVYRSSSSSGTYSVIASNVSGTNTIDSSPLSGYNYYKVEAHNSSTKSNLSNPSNGVNFTPQTPPCATLLLPENGATGVHPFSNYYLSWEAVQGVTSYDVYFGTSSNPSFVANILSVDYTYGYDLPSLAYNTTYYWKIIPKNGNILAQGCETRQFTTSLPCATLISPENDATEVALNTTLTWNTANGATSYDVYFGTSSNPPLVANVTSTFYSPTLASNTTYYWRIVSKNSNTSSGTCGSRHFSTISTPPPCATLLSPANGDTKPPYNTYLSWKTVNGATSYDIYFGTNSNPSFLTNVPDASIFSLTLTYNTTYYWKIIPKNSSGSAEECETRHFTTEILSCATLNTPNNFAINIATNTTLTWYSSYMATSYDVYFGTSSNPPLVTTVSTTSYTPSTLANNTIYYWKIIPKNDYGFAEGCEIRQFTTDNVGIIESSNDDINIYPNPTAGELKIESEKFKIEEVMIYDVLGSKHNVTQVRKHEGGILMDISHLSAGIYFVKIRTEAGEIVRKLVKDQIK